MFRSMSVNEGLVDQDFTFQAIVSGMLGKDDPELVREVAEECYRRCGGYPGKCTCVEQFVSSIDWMEWPNAVSVVTIPDVVKRVLAARAPA